MARAPERAIILKPCCIGDVLLATPLVRALAEAWPGTRFDWAVDHHSVAALSGNPFLSGRLDATGCVRGAYHAGALARLVVSVRRRKYDMAFIPDRSPVVAAVAFAARVPERVGLGSGWRGLMHTVRVAPLPMRHEAELYLDLARAVGVAVSDPRPVYVVSEADRAVAGGLLAARGSGAVLVAVHPGGGVNPGMAMPEKRWPAGRFAALVDRLVGDGARVVLLGGPGDRAVVGRVSRRAQSAALDLSGRLSLGETAAVIEACALYVGNDTGVTHLAAAVGTPVVAIFGPTDPRRYGPVPGTGVAVKPTAAPVSRLQDARGSRVVEEISVDEVWRAIARVLAAGCAPDGS